MLINHIKQRETFRKKLFFKGINPKFFYLDEALFIPKLLSKVVGVVFDKDKNIMLNIVIQVP